MKNIGLIIIISIIQMNIFANVEDQTKIVDVLSLTEFLLEGEQKIELFGVDCGYYKEFYNEFYIDSNSNYSCNTIDENAKFLRMNFEDKSITDEYNKALSFLKSLLIENEVTIEYIDEYQVILMVNEVNINEYLINNGFVKVDRMDKVINNKIIKKYLLLENEATVNEIGIWGMTFSVTSINGVGTMGFTNYSLFMREILIYLVIGLVIVFWISRLKSTMKYLMTVVFYISAFIVSFIGTPNNISTEVSHSWSYLMMSIMLIIALFHFVFNVLIGHKKNSYIYLCLNFIFITLLIISIFSFIYLSISNVERRTRDTYYDYPNFEFSVKRRIVTPYENYIEVPMENYEIYQSNNVNCYSYNFSFLDSLYFSSATYFTVGFGDYQPKGSLRIISMIEMIISYLMTVLIFGVTISKYSSNS